MKTMISATRLMTVTMIMLGSILAVAQSKTNDQRMAQDLEVAENILGTLLRQELGRRSFFPVEVKGNYVPGYGATFRMPLGSGLNRIMIGGMESMPEIVNVRPGYTYSFSRTEESRADAEISRSRAEEARAEAEVRREREQLKTKTARAPKGERIPDDSASALAQKRFMDVSRSFLADYGDVISGLKADERIVITNRSEDFEGEFEMEMVWINGRESKRHLMSVEAQSFSGIVQNQSVMCIVGNRQIQPGLQQSVQMCGRQKIFTPRNKSDTLGRVVDDDSQIVCRLQFLARQGNIT